MVHTVTLGPRLWGSLSTRDIKKMINSQWEHGIKRNFNGSSRPWVIDLPDRVSMGQLSLKSHQIRSIFDAVTSRILPEFRNQFMEVLRRTNQAPKTIILIGGLVQNPYVAGRLKDIIGKFRTENLNPNIAVNVQRPPEDHPLTAVARGLIWHGLTRTDLLNKPTEGRLSRYNYTLAGETSTSRTPSDYTFKILSQGQSIQGLPSYYQTIHCHWPAEATGIQTTRIRIFATRNEDPHTEVNVALLFIHTPAPVENLDKMVENGTCHHQYTYKVKVEYSNEGFHVRVLTFNESKCVYKLVPIVLD
ncbi:hypothetical protein F5Y13DRAFT_205517 [Hypoxylon sp. FL1857]|nr:hypothetical protein F5Y13DRAFT_205517 [Hypoxylon sp. FL1857]